MAFCPKNHPAHPDFAEANNPHCCRCRVDEAENLPPPEEEVQSAQSSNRAPPPPVASYEAIQTTFSSYYDPVAATVWIKVEVWDCSQGDVNLVASYPWQPVWTGLPPVNPGGPSQGLPPLP